MSYLSTPAGRLELRQVLTRFYDLVFEDSMIGFHFKGLQKERLIQKEWEFTLQLFEQEISYTGKPLRRAHQRHPIFSGHFNRRTQLLRQVLEKSEIPVPLQQQWLTHNESLRPLIVNSGRDECVSVSTHSPRSDKKTGKKNETP